MSPQPADDLADDGLLKRRLKVLKKVIDRELDGDSRALRVASLMAQRYRWPRLRTMSDVRKLKARGLLEP